MKKKKPDIDPAHRIIIIVGLVISVCTYYLLIFGIPLAINSTIAIFREPKTMVYEKLFWVFLVIITLVYFYIGTSPTNYY